MAASVYAALLSIARSLHQILDLGHYIDPFRREKIASLNENVDSIISFLEDYSDKCFGTFDLVGNGIRKASFEAQDFIDSYLCSISKTDMGSSSSEALDEDLNMALERIDFILEESMKMNKENTTSNIYSSSVDHSSTLKATTRKNMVVGLDDDLNKIKQRLYEDLDTLQIIPVIGMGGIGKTTLARRAYEDLFYTQHFDVCSWITVSAEYKRRDMLLRLLEDFKKSQDELSGQSDDRLKTLVYQHLVGRRYLVVIDDIWSTKVWDDLRAMFPDDGSGSRILLTSRLSEVAIHAGCASDLFHQMNFLNEDQSWKLLEERIFGQESCPLHLVEIGKKMARNCGGLPLTIVVVAGLISKGNTREQEWEDIAKNINSMEPTIELQCSKVLRLSYDRLPLRLKPCFLYITAFPEDSDVYASQLINLWVAEGFLKPSDQFSYLEDVGGWFLEDLVNKNLILVKEKERDGKPVVVGIHDLLREICITKAEEEGFFHHISSEKNACMNPNRRMSIHCTQNFHEWRIQDSSIRSVLLFSKKSSESRLYISCRQLTILDAPNITWPNLSDVIPTLISLRYIAFALNDVSCPHGFPASISKLPFLQTITASVSSLGRLEVPLEIWEMPELRRLIMNGRFHLSYPSDIGILHRTNIETLGTVMNLRFTEEVIKKLENLKTLNLFFAVYDFRWGYLELNNLFHLQNLQVLTVTMQSMPYLRTWDYAFPISLNKLSLRFVRFPWENMALIGSLPNLQMLEMMAIDVDDASVWTPMEGQFLRLKHFQSTFDYLVKWEVEKEHFPSLESLVFVQARSMDEIPCGIGEIDSLQLIELRYCKESLVDSAMQIQEQQHDNGNDSFQVLVLRSNK